MKETVVFWGAGKIGKEILDFWHLHSLAPDYFCDSNTDRVGTIYEDVEIIDKRRIRDFESVIIFITVYDASSILEVINSENFHNIIKVIRASSYINFDMLTYIYRRKETIQISDSEYDYKHAVMDFTYGTELGGVQTWCYQQVDAFNQLGIDCDFLMPDNRISTCDFQSCVCAATSNSYTRYDNYVDSYIGFMLNNPAGVYIINFPREIMIAAMIIKKLFRPKIKIIAIIHNDDDIYYKTYNEYKEYIDEWIVISDQIEKTVLNMDINSSKIHRLRWVIGAEKDLYLEHKEKSDCNKIQIGYAGRIVIEQKRIDRLINLALLLKARDVDFELTIAGTGESEEYLKTEIINNNLEKHVKYVGLINHNEIFDYWRGQDIYISCSDYEGHSISQCEAMAAGAVPVVTDTSGARDDIDDGKNGYIVSIGDLNAMVEKIVYLKDNPGKLKVMSEKCIDHILEGNKSVDEKNFWMNIWREM